MHPVASPTDKERPRPYARFFPPPTTLRESSDVPAWCTAEERPSCERRHRARSPEGLPPTMSRTLVYVTHAAHH
jgi:hypothetical protein